MTRQPPPGSAKSGTPGSTSRKNTKIEEYGRRHWNAESIQAIRDNCRNTEKYGGRVHDGSPFSAVSNSGNQCNNYMISRAFIPPWSLVMTKPETLGPDTSRKEAGTLVSRYSFTGKQFYTSHSEIQQEILTAPLSESSRD